jgi:hypothetical protein
MQRVELIRSGFQNIQVTAPRPRQITRLMALHGTFEELGQFLGLGLHKERWWRVRDLNPGPTDYDSAALTAELTRLRNWPDIRPTNS